MKNRFSPFVDRISGEGSEAWELHFEATQALAKGEDVIVLSIGDPNFDTAQPVRDAAIKALNAGDTHYAAVPGRPPLRQAVADWGNRIAKSDHLKSDNAIVLAGAQNALYSALQCLVCEGDEVLALDPLYVTYEAAIGATGAKLVRVQANAETGFRPNFQAIEGAITPKTKVLVFASPNNPSGIAFNEEEARQLEALVEKHDLWLMVDEVYAELMFEDEFTSILSLAKIRDRCVSISSLSKSHAMTGWRVGWAIGPADLITHMDKLALCMLYGLPGFIQQAALEALTGDQEPTARMCAAYKQRAKITVEHLSKLEKLNVLPPDAGMFCLVQVDNTGLTGIEFAQQLYKSTGVSVLAAKPFGESLSAYVRVSFATSDELLEEALNRICHFVESLA